jgi:cytoskeleton protein RodZ
VSIGNSPSDAASEAPLSIGRALHRARLDAGLTVDEISAATRVRTPIVRAIEEDDFSRCGGDVYARGHIRTLARAVGIDPAPLVEGYDAEHGGKPSPTPVAPVYEAERIRPEPRRPNWTAAMVAAIVVVVGFVGFTMFSGARSGTESAAGNAVQPSPTHPPTHPPASRIPEPTRSAIAAAPADKVTVKLTADGGKSWVTATANDGHSLFEGLLDQGQSKTFTDDKKISLVLGNAGAVKMFVNGKDLGTAGNAGQLLRTDFTPGNPQAG